MRAYRTYVTITEPGTVVLKDTPFQPGDRVEAVLLAESDAGLQLQTLLKATQALPQAKALSEEEIAAEVAAYRMADAS